MRRFLLTYAALALACSEAAPSSDTCAAESSACAANEPVDVGEATDGAGPEVQPDVPPNQDPGSPLPASGGGGTTATGGTPGSGGDVPTSGASPSTGGTSTGGSVPDPRPVPEGYQVVYSLDYETELTAANYLGDDVWYFYDGGSPTDNDNPEVDRRFFIETDPVEVTNKALSIVKFDDDDDYSGQGLNPRAELSLRPSQELSAENELYYRMRTFFPLEQAGIFAAEFTQFWLHGDDNIPLQLEVRDGVFKARRPGVTPQTISGEARLSEHAGRWLTWEVYAKFNQVGGYYRIYLDDALVYEEMGDMSDWPSDNGTFHTQYGAYANNGGEGTMQVYFDDYLIAIRP